MMQIKMQILEEAYIFFPTNISNMNWENRQKEKLAQHKYCIDLSNAELEQVLVQNFWMTNGFC